VADDRSFGPGGYKLNLKGFQQAMTPEAILGSIMAASNELVPFMGGVTLVLFEKRALKTNARSIQPC
jgi:hypothetical protein